MPGGSLVCSAIFPALGVPDLHCVFRRQGVRNARLKGLSANFVLTLTNIEIII